MNAFLFAFVIFRSSSVFQKHPNTQTTQLTQTPSPLFLFLEDVEHVVREREGAAVERGVVVARGDMQLVPAHLVEIADRIVLLRREAEEPVSGRIRRDVALVDGREGELEGDVPVGVADGPLVGGGERRLVRV